MSQGISEGSEGVHGANIAADWEGTVGKSGPGPCVRNKDSVGRVTRLAGVGPDGNDTGRYWQIAS